MKQIPSTRDFSESQGHYTLKADHLFGLQRKTAMVSGQTSKTSRASQSDIQL